MKKFGLSRLLTGALRLVLPLLCLGSGPVAKPRQPLNVLFIMADDLNNDLGCYGNATVRSPHIDRISARGIRFDRAYCQYPLCNPSRVSLLSGRRPISTGVVDNVTSTRAFLKERVLLPQFFRNHGYYTAKVGKIFHANDGNYSPSIQFEDPASWDVDIVESGAAKRPPPDQILPAQVPRGLMLNAADADTWDGRVARKGLALMEEAARRSKPFFIAVGFRRPHVPYIAPKKYFDLYPPERMPVREEPAEHVGNIPPIALTYDPKAPKQSPDDWRQIIRAYYAAVSFMDAQVGVLLEGLDRLKLWDRTVVVFVSDHGYLLGEHGGMWHKLSLFEEAARVPLIVAAPSFRSAVSAQVVELIDLYPTLAELCGLPPPAGIEGTNLVPLMRNPKGPWKKNRALTYLRRGTHRGATDKLNPATMAISVRTTRWRYTEWGQGKKGVELYDHDRDPREFKNLAADPAYAKTVAELSQLLFRPNPKPEAEAR